MLVVSKPGWLNADRARHRKHSNKWSRFYLRCIAFCGHSRLAWSHINTEHLNFQHTRQNSRALNWFYRIDCKKRKIIHLNYSATQTKSEPQCMYTRTLRAGGVCILLSALVYTKQERLGRQVQRNRRLKKKEKSIPSLTPLPRVVFICAPGVGNLTWMALAAR